MKIIKTASGKKRIKISKSEWKSIGKQAGWMQEEMEDMVGEATDEYKREFKNPTPPLPGEILHNWELSDILLAIKALGEQSIAGFSKVKEDEVEEILLSSEGYVLGEIRDWLKKTRPKKII